MAHEAYKPKLDKDAPIISKAWQKPSLEELVETKVQEAMTAYSTHFEAQVQNLVDKVELECESRAKEFSILASDVSGSWHAIGKFYEEVSQARAKWGGLERADDQLLAKIEEERAARMELAKVIDAQRAALDIAPQGKEQLFFDIMEFKTEIMDQLGCDLSYKYDHQFDQLQSRVEALSAATLRSAEDVNKRATDDRDIQQFLAPCRAPFMAPQDEDPDSALCANLDGFLVEERLETSSSATAKSSLASPQVMETIPLFADLVAHALGRRSRVTTP